MDVKNLLQYYDYLARLAGSKTTSQSDAEDLVSETMLAALGYIQRGGVIEYPKTFLSNTLLHKYNDSLRRKYRLPLIVNLDSIGEIGDYDERLVQIDDDNNEAALLRRELTYLAKTTREVLIAYYFAGRNVNDIAKSLGIPEGTVKSRLSSGRSQLKKGFGQMENQGNYLPGKLMVSWGGGDSGAMSLVEGDLIVQNLLILAYEKPLASTELARLIGIPTVYIEPILERLVNSELMVKTDGDKFYTDFIIFKPEDYLSRFDSQLAFVHERFDIFWNVMSDAIARVDSLEYSKTLNPRQLKKLERYTIMRLLQTFEIDSSGNRASLVHPPRRNGGNWTAHGRMFPAGYNYDKINETKNYVVTGGHRKSSIRFNDAEVLRYHEFDTTLWDSPGRFAVCGGFNNYFSDGGIIKLLWCVHNDYSLEENKISNSMIKSIDGFINMGLFSRESGKLTVDIPVMSSGVYDEVTTIITDSYNRLEAAFGEDFRDFIKGSAVALPAHLTGVPEFFRYTPATQYIVMAAVREAYGRKLHMHDVEYCCPPVILIHS